MIKICDLCKTFHGSEVLRNINASFMPGRVYGLSGPNGSGKTMLMRAILGLIKPSSGTIEIDGQRLGRDISFPPSVGVLLENPAFLDGRTGLDNLVVLASIKGVIDEAACRDVLTLVGLDPDDKRKFRKYSLGMKQRLGLAGAAMESPSILILDEPTNALDPEGVSQAMQLIRAASARGATVIIACHDVDVMRELADEIWYLAEGHVIKHEFLTEEPETEVSPRGNTNE